MTDNRDWAAEIVMEILNRHGTDDHIHLDKLCEALRAAELRGRVRGMEEAVELLEEAERNLDKTKPGYLPNLGLLGNLKIIFGWKIDKLQSPT